MLPAMFGSDPVNKMIVCGVLSAMALAAWGITLCAKERMPYKFNRRFLPMGGFVAVGMTVIAVIAHVVALAQP